MGDLGEEGIFKIWNFSSKNAAITSIFDINDLVHLILSFSDAETLFKMSQLNKKLRMMILHDFSPVGKDRQITILKFKLERVQSSLETVAGKIKRGDLIDVTSLNNNEQSNQGMNFVDIYMLNIAAKYPYLQTHMLSMKSREKLNLLGKLTNVSQPSSSQYEKIQPLTSHKGGSAKTMGGQA